MLLTGRGRPPSLISIPKVPVCVDSLSLLRSSPANQRQRLNSCFRAEGPSVCGSTAHSSESQLLICKVGPGGSWLSDFCSHSVPSPPPHPALSFVPDRLSQEEEVQGMWC